MTLKKEVIGNLEQIYDELEKRSFFNFLNDVDTEMSNRIDKLEKENKELSERLNKIDNFYNIANKLEMILDRLKDKPKSTHKKNI